MCLSYPLGFFSSGCSGCCNNTSPNSAVDRMQTCFRVKSVLSTVPRWLIWSGAVVGILCSQSAFLPRWWNLHINSVGSGQVPSRLDPAHSLPFPQIQWSSTQSSTENEREVLPLLLSLRGLACQLNKSHVTKSQCLGSPQTNILTCRPALCLTGSHSCGPKTG